MLQKVHHISNLFEMFPDFDFGFKKCEKNDYQLNVANQSLQSRC